jgi:hypothetical protein
MTISRFSTPKATWLREFTQAGKSKITSSVLGEPIYSYQMLGGVLRSGEYSPELLNAIGADMIQLEQRAANAFHHPMPPDSQSMMDADPMDGLMIALERNPEAGAEFFASDESRIGHVLDRPGVYGADAQSQAIDALAATGDIGVARVAIEHVGSTSGDAVGLTNGASRESMGLLLEGHVEEVNKAYQGGDQALLRVKAELDRVLGDVARSPEAYASFSTAERLHTAMEMREIATSDQDRAAKLADLTDRAKQASGEMAQLDHGRSEALREEWKGKEEQYNGRVGAAGGVSGYAMSKAIGAVPVIGDVAKDVTGPLLEGVSDGLCTRSTRELNGVHSVRD